MAVRGRPRKSHHPVIGEVWQMRFVDQMTDEGKLAYSLIRSPERLPEGVAVQITGITQGLHNSVHVRQTNNGEPYGRPLSYPQELFIEWFRRTR